MTPPIWGHQRGGGRGLGRGLGRSTIAVSCRGFGVNVDPAEPSGLAVFLCVWFGAEKNHVWMLGGRTRRWDQSPGQAAGAGPQARCAAGVTGDTQGRPAVTTGSRALCPGQGRGSPCGAGDPEAGPRLDFAPSA